MSDEEYLRIRVYHNYSNPIFNKLPQTIFSYLLQNPDKEKLFLQQNIKISNLLIYISKNNNNTLLIEVIISYLNKLN